MLTTFILCSAPRGPDGRILYDPYDRTKEECLAIGLVSVAILLVQVFIAYRNNGHVLIPSVGSLILVLHPAWTLRIATDARTGDCGALQLMASVSFLLIHIVLVIVQLLYVLWRRVDPADRADYGETSA